MAAYILAEVPKELETMIDDLVDTENIKLEDKVYTTRNTISTREKPSFTDEYVITYALDGDTNTLDFIKYQVDKITSAVRMLQTLER